MRPNHLIYNNENMQEIKQETKQEIKQEIMQEIMQEIKQETKQEIKQKVNILQKMDEFYVSIEIKNKCSFTTKNLCFPSDQENNIYKFIFSSKDIALNNIKKYDEILNKIILKLKMKNNNFLYDIMLDINLSDVIIGEVIQCDYISYIA
jgi:hypothetical protein